MTGILSYRSSTMNVKRLLNISMSLNVDIQDILDLFHNVLAFLFMLSSRVRLKRFP